jgi:hypothetical protein
MSVQWWRQTHKPAQACVATCTHRAHRHALQPRLRCCWCTPWWNRCGCGAVGARRGGIDVAAVLLVHAVVESMLLRCCWCTPWWNRCCCGAVGARRGGIDAAAVLLVHAVVESMCGPRKHAAWQALPQCFARTNVSTSARAYERYHGIETYVSRGHRRGCAADGPDQWSEAPGAYDGVLADGRQEDAQARAPFCSAYVSVYTLETNHACVGVCSVPYFMNTYEKFLQSCFIGVYV